MTAHNDAHIETKRSRASTATLEPGSTSIDRATPIKLPDGTYRLKWTLVLPDGRRVHCTSKGASVGEVKRRAKARAADVLRTSGVTTWKLNARMIDYVDQVTVPSLAKTPLTPKTRATYEPALRYLRGLCATHNHKRSLQGHTIASGTRYRALQDLLTEVAVLHGYETARHTRTVLTKYLLQELIRDGLLASNPIAGVSLEALTGARRATRTRGGRAITPRQYQAVLTYLLALDPAEGIVRRQGRWSLEILIAKHRNTIDQTLLQLATGLRSTEANLIDWPAVRTDSAGVTTIHVGPQVAKGGKARIVIVLVPEVARRLEERRAAAHGVGYVIGSPADATKVWEQRARDKAAASLYQQVAEALGIDVMLNERSHMWRTTLRSLYVGQVSPAVLAAQFGHTEDIAQRHYSDVSDLSGLVAAAGLADEEKLPPK